MHAQIIKHQIDAAWWPLVNSRCWQWGLSKQRNKLQFEEYFSFQASEIKYPMPFGCSTRSCLLLPSILFSLLLIGIVQFAPIWQMSGYCCWLYFGCSQQILLKWLWMRCFIATQVKWDVIVVCKSGYALPLKQVSAANRNLFHWSENNGRSFSVTAEVQFSLDTSFNTLSIFLTCSVASEPRFYRMPAITTAWHFWILFACKRSQIFTECLQSFTGRTEIYRLTLGNFGIEFHCSICWKCSPFSQPCLNGKQTVNSGHWYF